MSKGSRKYSKQENQRNNFQSNYLLKQAFSTNNKSKPYSNGYKLTTTQKWIAILLGAMVMSSHAIEAGNNINAQKTSKSNDKNKHKIENRNGECSLTNYGEIYSEKLTNIANEESTHYNNHRESIESFTSPGTICIEKNPKYTDYDSFSRFGKYACFSDEGNPNIFAETKKISENRDIILSIYTHMPDDTENSDVSSLSFLFQANDELKVIFEHIVFLAKSDPIAAAGAAHICIIKYGLFDRLDKSMIARNIENYILGFKNLNLIFHPNSKKYEEAVKLSIDKNNPNFYINYLKDLYEKINNGKAFNADNLRIALSKCKDIKEVYDPKEDCQKKYEKAKTKAEECKQNSPDIRACLDELDKAAIINQDCQKHFTDNSIEMSFVQKQQEEHNNCMNYLNENWYEIGVGGAHYNSGEDAFYN